MSKNTIMKNLLYLLLIVVTFSCEKGISQEAHANLYNQYEKYKEKSITDRRFKHADIVPLIQRLGYPFEKNVVGQSVEGRDIYLLKAGDGPIKVLLWSQMHGDEPTATMALMDIFNLLSDESAFPKLRKRLLENLTIYIIPMLNPDGAERFERRNAQGVDLNRDAVRQQTPEGRILKMVRDEVDADWGFNLHDQSRYYSAGIPVSKLASISFLAPAYNYEKDVNTKRSDAMKMIVSMNKVLQDYIPQQVARYSDAFEPRAFGDNIQKWGTRTILIESGGLQNDPEKQELRKLHFVILLHALESIALGTHAKQSINAYKNIPYNKSNGFKDLLITGANIQENGKEYIMDIGFKRAEISIENHHSFYYKGYIDDIGDLSVYRAYHELNAAGYTAVPGRVLDKVFEDENELKNMNLEKLIKDGYTDFFIRYLTKRKAQSQWPVMLHLSAKQVDNSISYGNNPSFFLAKGGENHYLVVNGQLWDLRTDMGKMKAAFSK